MPLPMTGAENGCISWDSDHSVSLVVARLVTGRLEL